MSERTRSVGRTQVKEELDVALLPGDGRRGRCHVGQSYLSGRGDDVAHHPLVHGWVADDALWSVASPGLELRLRQRHRVRAGPYQRRKRAGYGAAK